MFYQYHYKTKFLIKIVYKYISIYINDIYLVDAYFQFVFILIETSNECSTYLYTGCLSQLELLFKLFQDENIVNIQNSIFNVKKFEEKAFLYALCVM